MANLFLRRYEGADLVTRTRARNLFWVLVGFLGVTVALGALTVFTSEPEIAWISLALAVGLGVALALVSRGRYPVASWFTLGWFALAAGAAAFATRTGSTEDDVIRAMALFTLGLSLVNLYGSSWVQTAILALVGGVTMGALLGIPAGPDLVQQTIATVNGRANPAPFLILFGVAGAATSLALVQSASILARTQRAQQVTEEGFQAVSQVFDETRTGLAIGESMGTATGALAEGSRTVDRVAQGLSDQTDRLLRQADEGLGTTQVLSQAQAELKVRMDRQAEAIHQTSSALEEITANVRSIGESARLKAASLETLFSRTQEGARAIRDLQTTVGQMRDSAQAILSVVQVIEDISGRTNLLAMNASIEAAHAGTLGRGFGVVAAEIRKLAEETSRNSQAIRVSLDRNVDQVASAVRASGEAEGLMTTLTQTLGEVQVLLKEQLQGMDELSEGAGQILASVDEIRLGTSAVEATVGSLSQAIGQNGQQSEAFRGTAASLRQDLTDLKVVARNIQDAIATLQAAAGANQDYIAGLSGALAQVQTSMNDKKRSLE